MRERGLFDDLPPLCPIHRRALPCSLCGTFDSEASREARDEGIARAGRGAPDGWADEAYRAVLRTARMRERFIVDDVWQHVDEPPEGRAMGAVMTRARAAGVIEATRDYRPSSRRTAHSNPRIVWRSLVYDAGAALTGADVAARDLDGGAA